MKNYTKKGILQKMIISIAVIIVITNTIFPSIVRAEDVGGVLFKPIQLLFVTVGDAFMWLANKTVGGKETSTVSLMDMDNAAEAVFNGEIEIPTYSVTPEKIFANEVPILDVNIINPSEGSIAADLQKMVANWYRTFRNFAAVGLLSVLVYTAIRIIISSTISDKTKYKTMLKDWLVAFCLLFFMHYIMSFSVTIVEAFTKAIRSGMPMEYEVKVDPQKLEGYNRDSQYSHYFDSDGTIKTGGLTELIRFNANDQITQDLTERFAYTVMFIVVTGYTIFFLFFYIKRLIYIIFLTMISPLVALSYPLDKMGDGSAKGFNTWLREYMFNLIIQPLHLLLYYVLVGSAIELSTKYVLYPLIVMGCLLQAEKVLRNMFGFDKAKSLPSPLSPMLSGAAIMGGFNKIRGFVGGGKGPAKSGDNGGNKIRTASQHRKPNNPNEDLFDELPKDENNTPNIREAGSNGSIGSGMGANGGPDSSSNNYMDNGNSDISFDDDNYGESADKYETFPNADMYDYYTGNNDEMSLDDINARMQELEDSDFTGYAYNPEYQELARQKELLGDEGLDQGISFPGEDVPMTDGFGIEDMIDDNESEEVKIKGIKKIGNGIRYASKGTAAVLRKYGPGVLKRTAKGAVKMVGRGYGIAAGATLGVASGLLSDDMSNVGKFAAGGIIAGNAIGRDLGSHVANIPARAKETREKIKEISNTFDEASLTPSQIRERQNKILDKEYRRNKENQKKFKDAYKNKKITIDGKETDYWKYAMQKSQEFRNYGVDDIDTIIKMQKALDKKGMDIADHKGIMAAQLVGQARDEKGVEIIGKRLKDKKNIAAPQIKEIQDLIRAHNDTL